MKYPTTENINKSVVQKVELKTINRFLCHLCLMVIAQSIIVSGYLNSINTTIERRYKLTSREIGFVYMTYEFSCIPTTIVLSIIGYRLNRPRVLGISGLIMALGMFMFSLPHFVGSSYELMMCKDNNTQILCRGATTASSTDCSRDRTDTWALFIFCVSQLFIGIGSSPIYLLGPTYLWDNLTTKTYSFYSSIFYTCSGLGPPIGFLLGGIFLGIYIDAPKHSKCHNMNNKHALWLGAWWIGLVVVACITVIFVVPLLYFPAKEIDQNPIEVENFTFMMDNYGGDELTKASQTDNLRNQIVTPVSKVKYLSKISLIKFFSDSYSELTKLFSNSVWLLISLTTVLEQSVVQGCTTFISKYLQVIFNVPANHAGYIIGGLVVPGAIAGVAFGGFLMNRLQPNICTSIKMMIIIIASAGTMAITLMFLGCDDLHVMGVSVGYTNKTQAKYDLQSECNSKCHCVTENYEPICDSTNSRNFYSACYAGCTAITNNSSYNNYSYTNCACTKTKTLLTGKCSPKCPTYYLALVVIFLQVFLTAMGQIPINIITFSSVNVDQSSMALGVQVFMVRLFAFIPVPLYFGALYDVLCLVRINDECNRGSICREYNVAALPYVWLGTIIGIKLLSFFVAITTYICAKNKQNKTLESAGSAIDIEINNCSNQTNKDQRGNDKVSAGRCRLMQLAPVVFL